MLELFFILLLFASDGETLVMLACDWADELHIGDQLWKISSSIDQGWLLPQDHA